MSIENTPKQQDLPASHQHNHCISKAKTRFVERLREMGKAIGTNAEPVLNLLLSNHRIFSAYDIAERILPKDTSGVVVTEIYDQSPLLFVSVNDVIVELQKKKITSSKQFSKLIKEIIKKGAETLYLAIYNSNNQRSYITVKLK